jgi:hypothetical protein
MRDGISVQHNEGRLSLAAFWSDAQPNLVRGVGEVAFALAMTSTNSNMLRRNRIEDANGQAVAYTYFRRDENEAREANVLTWDEARRIAANITKMVVSQPAKMISCRIVD